MVSSAPRRCLQQTLAILLLVSAGLAIHLAFLGEPLLEGAAGKQTHAAMIARNLYRGRATLLLPVVDDVGAPGYFIKELPLVPGAAAALYGATGGVDEALGRLLSIAAWLGGVPLLAWLLRRGQSNGEALVAAAWWVAAPLAFVYARAFMSDAAMVTSSVAALLALVRWREAPAIGRGVAAGALVALALLLKPHALFWLAPAFGVVLAGRTDDRATAPGGRDVLLVGLATGLGCAIAAAWYLRAASIHRSFPTAGTTRLDGWFDAPSLLDPALYGEIGRQLVWMVFTPAGVLLALAGVVLSRRGWSLVERGLLAWGLGVLLQCLVFNTRMFDDFARGTEYYQLAMVPVAAMLIGRGVVAVLRAVPATRPALRGAVAASIAIVLAIGALREAGAALVLPERYHRILGDCARVRELTRPHDELFVLADRGGTILYYCDRRGATFVPARAVRKVFAQGDNVVGAKLLADKLDRASYVYIPFPELLGEGSPWLAMFDNDWERIATPGTEMRLYRRRAPVQRR